MFSYQAINYLQNFFELSYSALTKCSTGGLFSELKMNSKDKKKLPPKNTEYCGAPHLDLYDTSLSNKVGYTTK